MSSAAEIRNADREVVSAGATEVACAASGQPAEAGTRAGTANAGTAGPAGSAGRRWRWVAFGAVITAAVMDLLDSTIA